MYFQGVNQEDYFSQIQAKDNQQRPNHVWGGFETRLHGADDGLNYGAAICRGDRPVARMFAFIFLYV